MLRASAVFCELCKLLLDAGIQRVKHSKSRDGNGEGGGTALAGRIDGPFLWLDKGGWMHTIPGPEGSDKSVMEIERWGACMPDVMLPKEVTSNGVVRDDHKSHCAEPSTSEEILRPWIYCSVSMSSLKLFVFSWDYVLLSHLLSNHTQN
jgi:hypothetical protein